MDVVGEYVGSDGDCVGDGEGMLVGCVGDLVGCVVGVSVGVLVGAPLGLDVGGKVTRHPLCSTISLAVQYLFGGLLCGALNIFVLLLTHMSLLAMNAPYV
jgi:hypothetical protein